MSRARADQLLPIAAADAGPLRQIVSAMDFGAMADRPRLIRAVQERTRPDVSAQDKPGTRP